MLVEQAHDLISAHTTDDRNIFLYASDAFKRTLGIRSQVGMSTERRESRRTRDAFDSLPWSKIYLHSTQRRPTSKENVEKIALAEVIPLVK